MSYDVLRVPNQVISFDTLPTSILPLRYANVTCLGVVSYSVAIAVEDITAKFQQLIPYVSDINTDFTKAEYLIIRHESGDTEVLALPWIEEGTIVTTSVVNKQITLYDVSNTDNARISKMLRLSGFTKFNIKDL